ncbi:TPR-like protein [Athelia psychrophila]|uniref:TPR-like protein n=1 Tax=Athelia psychrophila TaxID=1759441 RepID=A0A166DIF9_9AGAM|nr:TPR-like protein [Fibularhizoctonia sp. CBS 109695]
MISITSLDVQVVGDLIKQSPSLHADHFFIFYVNGKDVCRSQRKPREPPPQWKSQKRFLFDFASTIRIVIFRRSLLAKRFPMKKYVVAEFNGMGIDFLDNGTEHEMTAESSDNVKSRISVRLDHSLESHVQFMKAVDEDMSRIGKVPGSDAAQAATTIAGQLGTVLQKIVPIVDEFAGAHPILYAAWTVLSSAYKVVQQQIIIDGSVRDLVEKLREVAGVASTCSNLPEIGGTINVLENIGRTALEAALLIHEYSGPSVGGKPSIFARTAKYSPTNMSSRITQCQKQFDDLIAILDRRLHLDTNSRVKNIENKLVLDKLERAKGASWNSSLACLTGTRVTIRSVINAWAGSIDDQNVFWLKGVAGSGKSAIAHTMAEAQPRTASCFFNRKDALRNKSKLLFPTIARDIAMHYPAIAADICTTLEDPKLNQLASASLSGQFEAFISGPLRRHPIEHPFLIVIDALDETVDDDRSDIIALLNILRHEVSKLPPHVRILVTSRSTGNPASYLSEQRHIKSYTIDIGSDESGQDIEAYIRDQLRDDIVRMKMGSSHSTEELVRDLKPLAEGLFIWIVTVFRYLREAYNPEEKLKALLAKSDTPGQLNPRTQMDSLYTVILEICGDWKDPEFCKGYRMIMGAIMTAKRPLSLAALRALHGGGTHMLSPGILAQTLGSVLMGLDNDHEPVRVLHLSFQEFITDHTSTPSKFHIAEKEHSGRLAKLCIQTMVREISDSPIGGTGYLLKEDVDKPGIPTVLGVSEQLLYCCEYWSDHVSDVDEPDIAIAQAVQGILPYHNTTSIEIVSSMSVFRGSLAVWRWLQIHAPEFKRQGHVLQASILLSLSKRLAYASRLEEALVASQEAVDLRRALAVEKSLVASNADLASALDNLSTHFSALGQQEEALKTIYEALDLCRALVAERPVVFNADLARSLGNLSVYFSNLGRHEEALVGIMEALDLYRTLVEERPVVFIADLARSLANLSVYFSDLGRHEEALVGIREALLMYRTLAAERPAAFNADLAKSLHSLSARLSALGGHEEALKAIEEALDIYRTLAAERPAAFNADLALALTDLSLFLSVLGQREEALTAIEEALGLYRSLAAPRPAVFNANLAMSLYNSSLRLSDLGRQEDALLVVQEASDLYRALAAERPAAFNADLALALTNLSHFLSVLGQGEEALTAIEEALGLYRALAAQRPAVFNANLAMSLYNSSLRFSDLGRGEEALLVIQEASDMYRALAEEQPAGSIATLATSLHNLSCSLSDVDRHEEALVAITEALELFRNLAAEQPAVFNADTANALDTMATCLSHVDRGEEALAAMQEAVCLCRALGTDSEQPAALNRSLYLFLINTSARLSDLERWAEALTTIQEVVEFPRTIAPELPAGHDPEVAGALENLYNCLLKANRQEEAQLILFELHN